MIRCLDFVVKFVAGTGLNSLRVNPEDCDYLEISHEGEELFCRYVRRPPVHRSTVTGIPVPRDPEIRKVVSWRYALISEYTCEKLTA